MFPDQNLKIIAWFACTGDGQMDVCELLHYPTQKKKEKDFYVTDIRLYILQYTRINNSHLSRTFPNINRRAICAL